jgi:hypothetical protein
MRLIVGTETESVAFQSLELVILELVERGLEVVEYDGVGETFEDEGQFPKRVDAFWEGRLECFGHGADVHDDESYRE